MMPRNAFFRLKTNSSHSHFNIHLRPKGELYLPFWGHIGHTVPDPADPGLPHLEMHLAVAPDASLMPTELFVAPNRGKKRLDPKKIPDFWTADMIPIVSERFRDALEGRAPGSGHYFPIDLYDYGSGIRFEQRYFAFICRRIARVEGLPGEDRKQICDASVITPATGEALTRIRLDSQILDHLSRMDIWCIFNTYGEYFISIKFAKEMNFLNLTGFKEKKEYIYGDLSHVWTDF